MLHDDDKKLFEAWTVHNYERHWSKEDSPLHRLDIAVIDDPQRASPIRSAGECWTLTLARLRAVTALIPIIRRESPRTRIVFRSHIQSEFPLCAVLWSFGGP